MTKFDNVQGVVKSVPVIECEQPFYLSFDVKVSGDVVPAFFMGEFARQLQKNLRVGDRIIMREGIIDNGKLVFSFIHMEQEAAKGRNVRVCV
jgi:hypothetical protein